MALKVFNSLTRRKEPFEPMTPGKVKMYVCGVTPYNHPHIGNARPFITWDVIRRFLEHRGNDVYHVQNFTDIDDKIIKAAQDEGVSWDVIANRYIASYFDVMDRLNIRRAHVYPRVSETLPEIVTVVAGLVEKGYGYVVDGDVYFAVEKFEGYGKLSGRTLDDVQAGARVDVDERKTNPLDFALWKAAKPGEPAWESPWGPGRPGWHIECTAMSLKYLGTSFDFHGGGSDLVFPHHENEIAQSEAYTGLPFVRYWLHNGFITVNEEKMSKSLGNFFLVKDILAHYSPEVLRFFILSTHYRSPLDFSDERLEEARRALDRLKTARSNLAELSALEGPVAPGAAGLAAAAEKAWAEFEAAMEDDFNSALAIGAMFGLAREINVALAACQSGGGAPAAEATGTTRRVFADMAAVLGILDGQDSVDSDSSGLVEKLMDVIVAIRQEARSRKDWATADSIRDRLGGVGIVLEDSPTGVRWKKK